IRSQNKIFSCYYASRKSPCRTSNKEGYSQFVHRYRKAGDSDASERTGYGNSRRYYLFSSYFMGKVPVISTRIYFQLPTSFPLLKVPSCLGSTLVIHPFPTPTSIFSLPIW